MAEEQPTQHQPEEEEPISLELEAEAPAAADGTKIKPAALRTFGGGKDRVERKTEFKRPLNVTGQGATRCRMFHSKIAVASLDFMSNQINEWIDRDNIEIKQVGHVIGIMEGKTPEPNMLVMVWY